MTADTQGMSRPSQEVLVVLWRWTEPSPHAGGRFWAAHGIDNDGRLRDWPKMHMEALGAVRARVVEGEGLDLLPPATAPEDDQEAAQSAE
jgi:hypothetical protein